MSLIDSVPHTASARSPFQKPAAFPLSTALKLLMCAPRFGSRSKIYSRRGGQARCSSALQSIQHRNKHDFSPAVSFFKFAAFFKAIVELMRDKSMRARELECLGEDERSHSSNATQVTQAIASQNNLVFRKIRLLSMMKLPTYARAQPKQQIPGPALQSLGLLPADAYPALSYPALDD
ncbi:hypothetical protein MSAN_02089600 [Mycena sanguinolenta]|uniref:Uncharacterized protein n=1 Tax=Mycena sanguinolenta TaxID=230812 RepID=A0A8H7CMT1_9AGAR|nr:hypothetical protein MSAN_02089600 [Mycena sanguinolenta]